MGTCSWPMKALECQIESVLFYWGYFNRELYRGVTHTAGVTHSSFLVLFFCLVDYRTKKIIRQNSHGFKLR